MIEIIRERGMGKTRTLIDLSEQSGLTMIVPDHRRANHIVKEAHSLGKKIPEPIVCSPEGMRGCSKQMYLVDDLDACDYLSQMIPHAEDIYAYAISTENIIQMRIRIDKLLQQLQQDQNCICLQEMEIQELKNEIRLLKKEKENVSK